MVYKKKVKKVAKAAKVVEVVNPDVVTQPKKGDLGSQTCKITE